MRLVYVWSVGSALCCLKIREPDDVKALGAILITLVKISL